MNPSKISDKPLKKYYLCWFSLEASSLSSVKSWSPSTIEIIENNRLLDDCCVPNKISRIFCDFVSNSPPKAFSVKDVKNDFAEMSFNAARTKLWNWF